MKPLLFGAVLAMLWVLFPAVLAAALAAAAVTVVKAAPAALLLAVAARIVPARVRRWAR